MGTDVIDSLIRLIRIEGSDRHDAATLALADGLAIEVCRHRLDSLKPLATAIAKTWLLLLANSLVCKSNDLSLRQRWHVAQRWCGLETGATAIAGGQQIQRFVICNADWVKVLADIPEVLSHLDDEWKTYTWKNMRHLTLDQTMYPSGALVDAVVEVNKKVACGYLWLRFTNAIEDPRPVVSQRWQLALRNAKPGTLAQLLASGASEPFRQTHRCLLEIMDGLNKTDAKAFLAAWPEGVRVKPGGRMMAGLSRLQLGVRKAQQPGSVAANRKRA